MMRRMDFWVDGSCTNPKGERRLRHMGCGVVGFSEGDRVEWSIPLGRGTESQAEILAIIKALRKVLDRPNTSVKIHSDSQYAIDMLSGAKQYHTNGWLIEKAKVYVAECGRCEFVKARAHSGDTLNDQADRLARRASRSIVDSLPTDKNGIPRL